MSAPGCCNNDMMRFSTSSHKTIFSTHEDALGATILLSTMPRYPVDPFPISTSAASRNPAHEARRRFCFCPPTARPDTCGRVWAEFSSRLRRSENFQNLFTLCTVVHSNSQREKVAKRERNGRRRLSSFLRTTTTRRTDQETTTNNHQRLSGSFPDWKMLPFFLRIPKGRLPPVSAFQFVLNEWYILVISRAIGLRGERRNL